jgi:glycosyltransferase involved in cell wall biosynthesis
MKTNVLVTAVMVTGMSRSRYDMAKIAIECFRQQSYPHRELLIVNHGPVSLHTGERELRELRVRKGEDETVGDLRNLALEHAHGDYVIAWDDDDWYAPGRIEAQLAAQSGDGAVVLANQIRVNLLNGCAVYERSARGLSGTILHPRNVPFRYRRWIRGSDMAFMNSFPNVNVLENEPSLYVRFYHGLNLWDAEHIMGRMADPSMQDKLKLEPRHKNLVRGLLREYGAIYQAFRVRETTAAAETGTVIGDYER